MKEEEIIKHQQDALFREVEEQVRIENMKKFWKKYGNFFIGAALLLIVCVGGVELFKYYKKQVAYIASNDFLSALAMISEDKNENAIASFAKIVKDNKNGLVDFAKIYEANLDSGIDSEKYLKLAGEEKMFEPAKEFLLLSYAYQNVGKKSKDEIFNILVKFDGKPSWAGAVKEIKALTLLSNNENEKAIEILNDLVNDENASSSFRARAKKLLQVIKK